MNSGIELKRLIACNYGIKPTGAGVGVHNSRGTSSVLHKQIPKYMNTNRLKCTREVVECFFQLL